ncbi:ATP-binding protein [Pseudomonas sp. MWU16-30317]|uniref:ATP-binding protein n=1 Tax=Pseudomonas sp. MWU16-30317 TaxID=2878095 RepID=UPI001CFB135B|nr:ATP-binding protein [Pseudomonas sp. MWU16-30317]
MLEHTPQVRSAPPIDAALDAALADCADEPIRVPGAIQPHGLLLSLAGQPLRIQQVSANCAGASGLDCDALLGILLSSLIPAHQAQLIEQAYAQGPSADGDPIRVSFGEADYSAALHRHEHLLIIELEPFVQPAQEQSRTITRVLRNLQAASTLETLFDISVHEIQALTGYDRVIIYRFEPEGHGKVVAQALTGSLPSYSGLNFPASDIPAQARALYRLNWIRVIPDATYVPVPLVPVLRPDTGQPLDLSFSTLRSVSPVHCEYLKNMGVQSSMSISLLEDGELWGLITCSHPAPLLVPREYRDACALIGQLLSVKICAIFASQIQQGREGKVLMLGQLAEAMASADREILAGLATRADLLQSLPQATGVAVLIEDDLQLFGSCPTPAQVRVLHQWIRDVGLIRKKLNERTQGLQGLGLFHSAALQQEHPPAAAYRDVASGVIAFVLPKPVDNAVIWFRPQLTSSMQWSGNPADHLRPGSVGAASQRLHPRQSFDVWEEQVVGIAQPWSRGDLYAAEDIRRSALERDLERQVRREQEAVRMRDELVAVVSHDLRNPMSIIIMQCGMMQRWAVSDSSLENRHIRRALGTIENATTRINSLLEDLLDTARIEAGRYQLSRQPLSVTGLLEETCALLVTLTNAKQIELNCTAADGLVIDADPERIFQVLSNLVGNAIKFTPQGGTIDIDVIADGGDVLFKVADNGIGIPAQNLTYIFQRYWSVKEGNPRGNGLGLYISQGIVAAHGGRLWAHSDPGCGSVFTFSVPAHSGPVTANERVVLKQSGTTARLAQSISGKLERQQLEDRATRAGLLNELNHRVKNTLATVQAIASLTASNSDSLATFRQSFDARLLALSQAHDALARAEWLSSELEDLIAQLQRTDGGTRRILLLGDPVTLEPRTSLSLSMVFHELMANAVQHGALSALHSSPGGHITLTATLNATTSPRTLKLHWLEADGPPVAATTFEGFGFRLIRRSIERELNGTAQVRFAATGLSWCMTLPWLEKADGDS